MPHRSIGVTRFRSRRDAEKVLAEIIQDGGHPAEYRIEEDSDGSCVISILESENGKLAGVLGA